MPSTRKRPYRIKRSSAVEAGLLAVPQPLQARIVQKVSTPASSTPWRPPPFGRSPPRAAGRAHAKSARGLALRLLRGLRPAGKLDQHAQRFDHRAQAPGGAADRAKTLPAMEDAAGA